MDRTEPMAPAGSDRRGAARLPLLHRASDGDERAFQLHPWSSEFRDRQLEDRFQRRQAPELHERAWIMVLAATVLLAVLGLAEATDDHGTATTIALVGARAAMLAPLIAYAARGRARRDQLNQLPYPFLMTAKIEAWSFGWFLVHVAVHHDPIGLDLTVLCTMILLSHLAVPNRWRLLTPVTGAAAALFALVGVVLGDATTQDNLTTLAVLVIVWACSVYLHHEIETSRRAEFMTVERTARYGERLEAAVQRAHHLEDELRRQANIDPLTSIGNRRWFFSQLELEFTRGRRTRRPLAVLILDVDHFKLINDQHGHPVGDHVLKHLTTVVRSTLRAGDLLARIGGEEFAVVMPETTQRDAHDIAERVRAAVAANPVLIPSGAIRLTVSVGLTICQTSHEEPTQALARADHALYEAKRGGRDLVIAR